MVSLPRIRTVPNLEGFLYPKNPWTGFEPGSPVPQNTHEC